MTKRAFKIVAAVVLVYLLVTTAYGIVTTISVDESVFWYQNSTDSASNEVGNFAGGDRGTPTNNDEAYLVLNLDDSTQTQAEFARITWEANDVTDSTKDGEIRLDVMVNDVLTNRLLIDEDSIDITGDTGITGNLTATNLSGTNTGDEALSTGGTALTVTDHLIDVDITPSAGSATLVDEESALQVKYDTANFEEGANGIAIKDEGVTYAEIQNVTAQRLLGRGTGAGDPEEVTVGTGLTWVASSVLLDTTDVNSTTWSDDLISNIGHTYNPSGTRNPTWSYQDGITTLLASRLEIDAATDEVQFTIQGHSTQTNELQVWETSAGTDVMTVDVSGNIALATWNGVAIDIGTYTNLTAGTNITLTDDDLSVDDAFLINDGDDTTTGDIVVGGGQVDLGSPTQDGTLVIHDDDPGGDTTVTFQIADNGDTQTITWPSDDGGVSEVLTSNGSGVLSWSAAGAGDMTKAVYDVDFGGENGVVDQAEQTVLMVNNDSGSTISAGTAVYISDFNVASNLPEILAADNDSVATMPAVGIVNEDILNGADGKVIIAGIWEGDTSSYAEKDALYVSGTGGDGLDNTTTTTKPTGDVSIQKIAIVTRSHAVTGELVVSGAGRSNDVPNAQYIVGAAVSGLSQEQVLTAGTAIDVTLAGGDGGAATVALDSTEVNGTTWGDDSAASIEWNWNTSDVLLTSHSLLMDSGGYTFDSDGNGAYVFEITKSGVATADLLVEDDIYAGGEIAQNGVASMQLGNSSTTQITARVDNTGSPGIIWSDGSATTAIAQEGDRLFHDTDADGTKDGGEEYIDQAGGGGMPDHLLSWSCSSMLATMPDGVAEYDGIAPTQEDAGTNNDIWAVSYDDTADEARGVQFVVPADIDTSGSVTFRVNWYSRAASPSGNCMWYIAEHDAGDGTTWDTAPTNHEAASDAAQTTTDLMNSTSWTETVSTLGWAAGETVFLWLVRDGDGDLGTDSLTGDAEAAAFSISIPQS
jgi:hypothetical protein